MEKRNILVTGVSRGLGIQIVKTLLEDDNVSVFGLSRSMTDELNAIIEQYPTRLKWLSYDLGNVDEIRTEIFKEFIGFKTPLHGFVNNAAVAYDDIVTNLNYEPLLNMYNANLFAPMLIVNFALRHFLLLHTKGSIVHLSSFSVHTCYKGFRM